MTSSQIALLREQDVTAGGFAVSSMSFPEVLLKLNFFDKLSILNISSKGQTKRRIPPHEFRVVKTPKKCHCHYQQYDIFRSTEVPEFDTFVCDYYPLLLGGFFSGITTSWEASFPLVCRSGKLWLKGFSTNFWVSRSYFGKGKFPFRWRKSTLVEVLLIYLGSCDKDGFWKHHKTDIAFVCGSMVCLLFPCYFETISLCI